MLAPYSPDISHHQVEPKRQALRGAQEELAATMASLAEAQAKLKAVEEKINLLTSQFEEAMAKKEALAKQVGSDPLTCGLYQREQTLSTELYELL